MSRLRKFLCRVGLHRWDFDPIGAVYVWDTDHMSCTACGHMKPATAEYYRLFPKKPE